MKSERKKVVNVRFYIENIREREEMLTARLSPQDQAEGESLHIVLVSFHKLMRPESLLRGKMREREYSTPGMTQSRERRLTWQPFEA